MYIETVGVFFQWLAGALVVVPVLIGINWRTIKAWWVARKKGGES